MKLWGRGALGGAGKRLNLLAAEKYSKIILRDDPLFYLPMDEGSGTTAADLTASAFDGTVNGAPNWGAATLLAGETGPSMEFVQNGADYVSVPYDASFGNLSGVTHECWIRPDLTGDALQLVTDHWQLTDNGSTMRVQTDGAIEVWVGDNGTHSSAIETSTGVVTAGQVHHIAFTYDKANVRIYVDGAQVHSAAHSVNIGGVNKDFWIGRRQDGGDYDFDGEIGHVAFYDYALSATQIYRHYIAGAKGKFGYALEVMALNINRYWRLGETSGTTANEERTGTDNGTYTGGVTLGITGALTGDSDKAASFDGTNDYISLPIDFSNYANLTQCAWVWVDSFAAGHHRVFSQESVVYVGRNGNDLSAYYGNGTTWVDSNTALGDLSTLAGAGTWAFVCWVKDGTTARTYVNGEDTGVTGTAPTSLGSNANEVRIAASPTAQWWNGDLDEPFFAGKVLTPTEIRRLYRRGLGDEKYVLEVMQHGPVGWWRLDETSGTSAADSSGNGHTGTINGSPTLGAAALHNNATASIDFDEVDDEVVITGATSPGTGAWSFETWCVVDNAPTTNPMSIFTAVSDTTSDSVSISVETDGTLKAQAYDSSEVVSTMLIDDATVLTTGTPLHIVYTTDGTTGYLYLDGALIGTSPSDGSAFSLGATTMEHTIGNHITAARWWDGRIGDHVIYPKQLSGVEIAALYRAGQATV